MSAVIRHRETGRPVVELFDKANIEYARANLRPDFELVNVHQHLVDLNDPTTPAYTHARRFSVCLGV